jgi:hypothetical protein
VSGWGGWGEGEVEVEVEDGRRCAPQNENEVENGGGVWIPKLQTANSKLQTENSKLKTLN